MMMLLMVHMFESHIFLLMYFLTMVGISSIRFKCRSSELNFLIDIDLGTIWSMPECFTFYYNSDVVILVVATISGISDLEQPASSQSCFNRFVVCNASMAGILHSMIIRQQRVGSFSSMAVYNSSNALFPLFTQSTFSSEF